MATQMFASLRYINTHHSFASIPGQPDQQPNQKNEDGSAPVIPDTQTESLPDDPQVFQANLRELARDLVMKEQQIEYLIKVLPGIGNSAQDQNDRIKQLEQQLKDLEGSSKQAAEERDEMLEMVEKVALDCRRVQ